MADDIPWWEQAAQTIDRLDPLARITDPILASIGNQIDPTDTQAAMKLLNLNPQGGIATSRPSTYVANPEQSQMNAAGQNVDRWQNQATVTQSNLAQFYQTMMAPLDFNDPHVKSIMQGSNALASKAANAQGLSGSIDNGNTQRTYSDMSATQMPERHQLAAGALGQYMNNDLNWQQLRQQQQLGLGQIAAGQTALGTENQGQLYNENYNNTYAPYEVLAGVGGIGLGAYGKLANYGNGNNSPYYPAPTQYSQPAGPSMANGSYYYNPA